MQEGAAMAARRFSGASIVLLVAVLVAISMYTCAFLGGAVLGRAVEAAAAGTPEHRVGVSVSIRGAVHYFIKELSDLRGGGRYVGGEAAARVNNQGARFFVSSSADDKILREKLENQQQQLMIENLKARRIRKRSNFSGEITHAWPRRSVIKVGPWGGSGGQPFYMRGTRIPRLRSITVYHSAAAIHSLSVAYSTGDQDEDAEKHIAGPWGLPNSFGSTAVRATIKLSEGERLTAVEGTYGRFGRRVLGDVVTSLTFRTSSGKAYGPYGEMERQRGGSPSPSMSFSVPAAEGCIVGFWGRSGWLLDAVGVYVRACTTPAAPAAYYYGHQQEIACQCY